MYSREWFRIPSGFLYVAPVLLFVCSPCTQCRRSGSPSLWCVFGPFYFLFMHHDLLDEEPQQLRCQRLNVRVPLRFIEEGCRIAYRLFQPLYFRFSLRKSFCQLCLFICVAGNEHLELFCCNSPQYAGSKFDFLPFVVATIVATAAIQAALPGSRRLLAAVFVSFAFSTRRFSPPNRIGAQISKILS